jgi:hypothetical protein
VTLLISLSYLVLSKHSALIIGNPNKSSICLIEHYQGVVSMVEISMTYLHFVVSQTQKMLAAFCLFFLNYTPVCLCVKCYKLLLWGWTDLWKYVFHPHCWTVSQRGWTRLGLRLHVSHLQGDGRDSFNATPGYVIYICLNIYIE